MTILLSPQLCPHPIKVTSRLLSTHESTNNRQTAGTTTASLLLLLVITTEHSTESKTTHQLVDTETTEEAIDEPTETEAVEQLSDETEDTGQQQTDGGQDLEQRLRHQAPERVELLLGVWHVRDALLGVVDGRHHRRRQFLERLGQAHFFGRGFAAAGAALGLGGDVAVWVEAAE